jgi:PAS domain S-box-containing protein
MVNSDWFYSSLEFQNFFKGASRSLVMKANDPLFTVLAVSDKYLYLTHRQRHEVLGKGLFETYPGAHSDPNEMNSVFSSFVRVINSKKTDQLPVFKYEISVGENGIKESHYWTNVNEPVLDAQGNVAYIINTTTNITEQIRQQNALLESENRFRLMAEGTDVMIAVGDESGEAVYFNKAWELSTGRTAEELLKFGWVDLMHPDDRPGVMDIFNHAHKERKPWIWEFRMPAGEGRYRWLMARGTPRFNADGTFAGYISSSVDITNQKEQQADLLKLNEDLLAVNEELTAINEELQQAQTELIFSNSQLANSEASLLVANSKLEESEHLLKLAIESGGLGIWIANLKTGKLYLSERAREIQGIIPSLELTLEESFSLIDPIDRENVADSINAAVENNGSFITEYKINQPESGSTRWLRASGIVQNDDKNTPVSILGTILDITEDRLNDQRKNDFISMVSHELKTPLTSIKGYVQILESRASKNDDRIAKTFLSKTNKHVAKMTTLINDFLNVSRLESAEIHIERTKFNLAALLAEVREDSLASINSHRITFAPIDEAFVLADWDKIEQVLNNLINNAVKYAQAGTKIKVACVTKGDSVTVSVSDEGVGISPENLPKLFERYYRIEGATPGISGFGIGLYLSYEIIKRHNGHIWAESKLGLGSTFNFRLPLLIGM